MRFGTEDIQTPEEFTKVSEILVSQVRLQHSLYHAGVTGRTGELDPRHPWHSRIPSSEDYQQIRDELNFLNHRYYFALWRFAQQEEKEADKAYKELSEKTLSRLRKENASRPKEERETVEELKVKAQEDPEVIKAWNRTLQAEVSKETMREWSKSFNLLVQSIASRIKQ